MSGILQPSTGTPTQDYLWPQGADLVIPMIYESGPDGAETPENLVGGSLRMDIVTPDGTSVYTFNTDDADPATADEATLGAAGEITIVVPRSLTLPPSGAVYMHLTANPPVITFNYDIFLRKADGKQEKLLRGAITIERSHTLWA